MKELLNNKKYMLYWFATTFSMAASNVIQFVLSLYVLDITGSAVAFSSILSIIIIPRLIFSPVAGYIADRFQRIRSMIIINSLVAMVILVYAVIFTRFNSRLLFPIYILVILLEIFEILYNGSAAGLIKRLVEERLLSQASAFAAIDDGIVGLCAPVMAGFVYHFLGLSGGLWLVFALLCISIILKLGINLKEDADIKMSKEDAKKGVLGAFVSSLKVILKHNVIWNMLILFPIANFFLASLFSVTNVYVLRNVLSLDSAQIGGFQGAIAAVYAIIPVTLMGVIKKMNPVKYQTIIYKLMFLSLFICSLILIFVHDGDNSSMLTVGVILFLSCVLVACVVVLNVMNSLMFQVIVPDTFIGRFYSVMRMLATISIPVSQVLYGFFSDYMPVYFSYIISCLGILICAVISANIFKGYKELNEMKISIDV